ncbi:MAG: hypothetical protein ACYC63_20165 [Armatimonadota bacterium]
MQQSNNNIFIDARWARRFIWALGGWDEWLRGLREAGQTEYIGQ